VPLAYWTAGLVSWRKGDTQAAANSFEHLAGADNVSYSNKAAGAYWSARAHLVSKQPAKVTPLLAVAAQPPTNSSTAFWLSVSLAKR
jgi:hypothetical protein